MRTLIQTIRTDYAIDPRFFAFVGIVGGLFSLIACEWLLLWVFAMVFLGAVLANGRSIRESLDE